MSAIYILSFQGLTGGLTFPMQGTSLHWFVALFSSSAPAISPERSPAPSPSRSSCCALTVAMSVLAGLAFRRRFPGATLVFYLAVASLIMPGILVGLGVGLTFQLLGIPTSWYTAALGAQLTWTLPFGLLIMFAVLSRFDRGVRGGGARSGSQQLADLLDGGGADPVSRHDRGGAVRLHAEL